MGEKTLKDDYETIIVSSNAVNIDPSTIIEDDIDIINNNNNDNNNSKERILTNLEFKINNKKQVFSSILDYVKHYNNNNHRKIFLKIICTASTAAQLLDIVYSDNNAEINSIIIKCNKYKTKLFKNNSFKIDDFSIKNKQNKYICKLTICEKY